MEFWSAKKEICRLIACSMLKLVSLRAEKKAVCFTRRCAADGAPRSNFQNAVCWGSSNMQRQIHIRFCSSQCSAKPRWTCTVAACSADGFWRVPAASGWKEDTPGGCALGRWLLVYSGCQWLSVRGGHARWQRVWQMASDHYHIIHY